MATIGQILTTMRRAAGMTQAERTRRVKMALAAKRIYDLGWELCRALPLDTVTTDWLNEHNILLSDTIWPIDEAAAIEAELKQRLETCNNG